MELAIRPVDPPHDDSPVTMLELFFDLVFVFVITQVTTLINPASGLAGYGRAALVPSLTWYIYNGFAWLTNNVAPTTLSTQLPMFAAMACFLAMAVVVPDAFGDGAWVFALAYLAVVIIHAAQFARSSMGNSARAIREILPVAVMAAGDGAKRSAMKVPEVRWTTTTAPLWPATIPAGVPAHRPAGT